MKLQYIGVPSLPTLAWCALIRKNQEQVTLFHGAGVVTRPEAFVEGAWNGDFNQFNFLEASVMSGTGGQAEEDSIRFTGSTDRLNPLCSVDTPKTLYVSNSLLLAMSASGEEPDPIYPYYPYDLIKIWREGLFCQHGSFPLRSGRNLGIHFGTILEVKKDCSMKLESHDAGILPLDYTQFKALLDDAVSAVITNAQAAERKAGFRPLAALSRGYDSTASAILAREAGCRETVSLLDTRDADPTLDSGLINAERLGMTCHEVDRWRHLSLDAAPISELSLFGISTTSPMAGFEDLLPGKIFVSGHFGDTIYDPTKSAVCNELSQTWAKFASGVGVMEYRLRVGFLTFAPFLIMARHHLAIHNMTHAPAMQDWHVEGGYNRPILRRIIEEAGLPRGSFAMHKKGGGHSHFPPKKREASPAMKSYLDYLRQQHAEIERPRRAYWRTRVSIEHSLWDWLGTRKAKFVLSTPQQRKHPFLKNCPPIKLPWSSMFTFQWAHSTLAQNYRLPELPVVSAI
jgi:hypothetical protein